MYDSVDKSTAACKQVPAATFSLGAQTPLVGKDSAYADPDPTKRPATVIGASLTIPF